MITIHGQNVISVQTDFFYKKDFLVSIIVLSAILQHFNICDMEWHTEAPVLVITGKNFKDDILGKLWKVLSLWDRSSVKTSYSMWKVFLPTF